MKVTIEVTQQELEALDTCIFIADPDDLEFNPPEISLARDLLDKLQEAWKASSLKNNGDSN